MKFKQQDLTTVINKKECDKIHTMLINEKGLDRELVKVFKFNNVIVNEDSVGAKEVNEITFDTDVVIRHYSKKLSAKSKSVTKVAKRMIEIMSIMENK